MATPPAENRAVSLAGYADLELIGEGVSARVYKATDTVNGGTVAIKVLNPHLKTDEISIERFRREIQITRFLNHSQIISIYDLVSAEDGLYLVMEYIPGVDLKQFLQLHGPLAVPYALGFLKQILTVLQVCHAKHVIHRDLKPQNVIVDPEYRVKLLDFGIARMTSLSDLTQTGTSLGSPEYMAPELFATNTFDPRTDLYAVGVIAYEMLTGELPYQGDSVPVLFNEHLSAPVPRVSATRSDVPAWLDAVIEKLLAKNAYERYQTASEALSDIGHQRVVSKSLPEMARQECLSCGRQTASEVPICTFCGYGHGRTLERRGERLDIFASPGQDRAQLEAFLAGIFPLAPKVPKLPAPLLASGIDRPSAELLKRSALKHGIYLRIQRSSPLAIVARIVSSYLLLFCGLGLASLVVPALLIYQRTSAAAKPLALIALGVLVCWGALRFFRSTHRRPLLGRRGRRGQVVNIVLEGVGTLLLMSFIGMIVNRSVLPTSFRFAIHLAPVALWWLADRFYDFGIAGIVDRLRKPISEKEGGESLLPRGLLAEHGWLERLAPRLGKIQSEDLSGFASRLIERYTLLCEHAPDVNAEIRERLRDLVGSAVEVAVLLSELEATVGDARLADWSRQYFALRERVQAETDAEQRVILRQSAEAAAARLRRFYQLDEKHSALRGRLIHLQYAFNTLLGKALVFNAPLDASVAQDLETAISGLERDLAVSKEVRKELGELI